MAVDKFDWEHKREQPEGIKIQLSYVGPGMMPDEKYVKFEIGDKAYGGWMPEYAVNEQEKWLKAFVIADFDDGKWLVQLPDETRVSGRNIFVPEAHQDVILKGWW